jgi:hypothetical protein
MAVDRLLGMARPSELRAFAQEMIRCGIAGHNLELFNAIREAYVAMNGQAEWDQYMAEVDG